MVFDLFSQKILSGILNFVIKSELVFIAKHEIAENKRRVKAKKILKSHSKIILKGIYSNYIEEIINSTNLNEICDISLKLAIKENSEKKEKIKQFQIESIASTISQNLLDTVVESFNIFEFGEKIIKKQQNIEEKKIYEESLKKAENLKLAEILLSGLIEFEIDMVDFLQISSDSYTEIKEIYLQDKINSENSKKIRES